MSSMHWYTSDEKLWKFLRQRQHVLELRRHWSYLQLGLGGCVGIVMRSGCPWAASTRGPDTVISLKAYPTGRVYLHIYGKHERIAESFEGVVPAVRAIRHAMAMNELAPLTNPRLMMPEADAPSNDDLTPYHLECRKRRVAKFREWQAKQPPPKVYTPEELSAMQQNRTYTRPPELEAACQAMIREIIAEEDEKFLRFVNEAMKSE